MLKSDLDQAQRVCELIHELTADEGDSVHIFHDNPDFGGKNCAIEIHRRFGIVPGKGTRFEHSLFYGDSLIDCLEQAKKAREE